MGHQGLFFDRLEATGPATTDGLGTGGRQLVADVWPSVGGTSPTASSPRGLYQNRNRTLDPVLGRFLQRDPNASGSVVAGLWHGGVAPTRRAVHSNVESTFTDGINLAQCVGSDPVRATDPTGLLVTYLLPGPTDMVRGALTGLVGEYAANLEWDVDWALNIAMEDDWSTREDNSWVEFATLRVVYDSFQIGLPGTDINFNPLDPFLASGGGPGAPAAGAKPLGNHRIATDKHPKYTPRLKAIFQQAGITNMSAYKLNNIRVPHGGRHPRGNHDWIEIRLRRAVGNLNEPAAKAALESELRKIENFFSRNPKAMGFLYDSVGRGQTAWANMRHRTVDASGGRRIRVR